MMPPKRNPLSIAFVFLMLISTAYARPVTRSSAYPPLITGNLLFPGASGSSLLFPAPGSKPTSAQLITGSLISSGDSTAFFCPPCGGECDNLTFAKAGTCPHCGMTLVRMTHTGREKMINNTHKKMSICFYLQDGVEVLDFAGPMEVFTNAGFQVFTVSRKKDPILAQGILKIQPDYSIEDAPPSDILAFFGGNTGPASGDPAVMSWIQSRRAATQYFFSVCTGAFIIGKAGILDSLTATTFHLSIESLRKALPAAKVLSDVRFVDNGKVITTAGISAGIDGALHLVAKLQGEAVAKQVAAYMEYDKWIPGQGLIVDKK